MVKIVKKKKKFRIEGLISLVFVVSILAYFGSVTILRSHNVVLSKQETSLENSIDILENDVANLELEVKRLGNRDRIIQIAEEHGLKMNQENIVSVNNE